MVPDGEYPRQAGYGKKITVRDPRDGLISTWGRLSRIVQ
jgi:hypothetical protein